MKIEEIVDKNIVDEDADSQLMLAKTKLKQAQDRVDATRKIKNVAVVAQKKKELQNALAKVHKKPQ